MKNLAQKIKNTALFTPDEKIEILASIETFSDSDKLQLSDIVDEYDREFNTITITFKQNMISHLDDMQKHSPSIKVESMRQAVQKIKTGLDLAIPSTTS